ncbi:MAG: Asp-tRNA(Asn)/Glu-tRNA(Gln) amidotransferase subunit GatB [Patescibacteria group bacterium]
MEAIKMEVKTIIGLEIHVQLKTKSKMFCSCSADYFNDIPNSHMCPVCLGLPGALPVINKEAIAQAIRVGRALNLNINEKSRFDRKNYMYPDLFKGYQITQFEFPITTEGYVYINTNSGRKGYKSKKIRILRAHMEEDTAKSTHYSNYTLLDGNKAGVPLLEIVSYPDMESKEEAKEYAKKIYNTVRFIQASDCDMEKGQMRFDLNVNLKIIKKGKGSETKEYRTPIVEVKNLNSFRALERATAYEEERQLEEFNKNEEVAKIGNKVTRGWNDNLSKTFFQREKEESNDYRYFPEPDLPPLYLDKKFIDNAIRSTGVLPDEALKLLEDKYKIGRNIAITIVEDRSYYNYFLSELITYKGSPSNLANWVAGYIVGLLNESGKNISDIRPGMLAILLNFEDEGKLSSLKIKDIIKEVILHNEDLDKLINDNIIIKDDTMIESIISNVLENKKEEVLKYKAGKEGILSYLIGQVMREMQGRADPSSIKEKLLEKINSI